MSKTKLEEDGRRKKRDLKKRMIKSEELCLFRSIGSDMYFVASFRTNL